MRKRPGSASVAPRRAAFGAPASGSPENDHLPCQPHRANATQGSEQSERSIEPSMGNAIRTVTVLAGLALVPCFAQIPAEFDDGGRQVTVKPISKARSRTDSGSAIKVRR